MSPPFLYWINAFVWTCAIEIPIYALFFRRRFESPWPGVGLAFLLQAATHPVLWYVIPQWEPYEQYVVVAEIGVTLTEALLATAVLLWRDRSRPALTVLRCTLASITANTVSTVIGLLKQPWLYG